MTAQELSDSEHLIDLANTASHRALLNTIQAVASAAGITEVGGASLREYHKRQKRTAINELISALSQVVPQRALRIRQMVQEND